MMMQTPSFDSNDDSDDEKVQHLTKREVTTLLLLFFVTRITLTAAGMLSLALLPSVEGAEYTHLLDDIPALDMWYRWDAGFYSSIATYGYTWLNEQRPSADIAFLPLYPFLVRLASGLTPSGCALSSYWSTCTTIGGLLVSNSSLLVALFLLYDLTHKRFGSAVAWRASILLMIAPNAIFFAGVYTESLFLLLCLLVFWLLERDQFNLAVLVACLAALTRSVGVALYPALLCVAYTSLSSKSYRRVARVVLAHMPLLLFAGYILAIGLYLGDPFTYFKVYSTSWERSVGTPIDLLWQYFSGEPVALLGWRLSWLDLIAAAVYLMLARATFGLDRCWGFFALLAILIPIFSGSLISMPRYGAVIFPFYIIIANWMRRSWQQILVYAMSIGLALLFAARFVTWSWIA